MHRKGEIINNYRLLRNIGEGRFGKVYEVYENVEKNNQQRYIKLKNFNKFLYIYIYLSKIFLIKVML